MNKIGFVYKSKITNRICLQETIEKESLLIMVIDHIYC